jgi:hypothetical protein
MIAQRWVARVQDSRSQLIVDLGLPARHARVKEALNSHVNMVGFARTLTYVP